MSLQTTNFDHNTWETLYKVVRGPYPVRHKPSRIYARASYSLDCNKNNYNFPDVIEYQTGTNQ